MISQLEASRLLNSDAIVECVASTSEPSALPVKTPIIKIPMARRMGAWTQCRFFPGAVVRGSWWGTARSGSSGRSGDQGINWLPEEELSRREMVRGLSLGDESSDRVRGRKEMRRGVRSASCGVSWPWVLFCVLIVVGWCPRVGMTWVEVSEDVTRGGDHVKVCGWLTMFCDRMRVY